MKRAILSLIFLLLVSTASTSLAQMPGFGPYGYGGFGYGGFGAGAYGGFGPYGYGGLGYAPFGFGVRGYYPPNPFGNMNLSPPIPPSPYYVVPSGGQYLDSAMSRDRATYADIELEHGQKRLGR